MINKCKVTIIVPVYNSAKYLNRCLDSLVYQTLNDIEVLCINNGSTDESEAILQTYQRAFPNKVVYYNTQHFNFAGHGRNLGIEKANGEYIGFCDSDDVVELDYFENLYNTAMQKHSDLVFAPLYFCKNGDVTVAHRIDGVINKEKLIVSGNVSTWNKLYKTSFLRASEKQPEDFCFEDFAWYVTLVSKASVIDYCDKPGYFYIIREESETMSFNREKALGLIKACEFSEKYCSKRYLNLVRIGNIKRIVNAIDSKWQIYDDFAQYLTRTIKKVPHKYFLHFDESVYLQAMQAIKSIEITIPHNICVSKFNHFDNNFGDNGFLNDYRIVVLDEHTCDINENMGIKYAYDKKLYDYVSEYFALRYIYEFGGIYFDSDIIVDFNIEYLLHLDCFFVKLDDTRFFGGAFGAKPHNPIIKYILSTYDNPKMMLNMYNIDFQTRVKHCLNNLGDEKLFDDKVERQTANGDKYFVFGPQAFIFDVKTITNRYSPNFHFTHLRLDETNENFTSSNINLVMAALISTKTKYERMENDNFSIDKINQLEMRLQEIEHSRTYRLAKLFKKISNVAPVKWFKKPLIKLLKI